MKKYYGSLPGAPNKPPVAGAGVAPNSEGAMNKQNFNDKVRAVNNMQRKLCNARNITDLVVVLLQRLGLQVT